MSPKVLYCKNSGAMIATPGKKLIARIRVIAMLLKRKRRRAMAHAAMEPKNRQITVVTPEMIVLFTSAFWKRTSPNMVPYEAAVGFWGRKVGGEAKSSVLTTMLILNTHRSGATLTSTNRIKNA